MEKMEFGEKLKRTREERGMTQQTLADKLYVTRQAVSRWERGSRYPDLMMAKQLAKELDVTIDELVSGEEYRRNVEKEVVLAVPKASFIQTALYAAVVLVNLFFCLFCMPMLFQLAGYFWSDGSRIQNSLSFMITFSGFLGYVAAGLIFGVGLCLSVRNTLSASRIGWLMVIYFMEETVRSIGLCIGAAIMVKRIQPEAQVTSGSIVAILAKLAAAITVYLFFCNRRFSGRKQISVVWVYAAVTLCQIFVLREAAYLPQSFVDAIRLNDYTSYGSYTIGVVHLAGGLALLALIVLQAYSLDRKRRVIISEPCTDI